MSRRDSGSHGRRHALAVLLIVVIVVVGLPLAVAGWVRYQSSSTWSSIRDTSNRIATPSGWRRIGTYETGSTNCVISCDSPTVNVLYQANVDHDTACRLIRASVAKVGQIQAVPQEYPDYCGWYSPYPHRVPSLKRNIFPRYLSTREWRAEFSDVALRPADGHVVTLRVSSGLD